MKTNVSKIVLLAAMISCFSSRTEANLGETIEQNTRRYGKAVSIDESVPSYEYFTNGFAVSVAFYSNSREANCIAYTRKEGTNSVPLSNQEMAWMLASNAQTNTTWTEWEPDPKLKGIVRRYSDDGKLTAVYNVRSSMMLVAVKDVLPAVNQRLNKLYVEEIRRRFKNALDNASKGSGITNSVEEPWEAAP